MENFIVFGDGWMKKSSREINKRGKIKKMMTRIMILFFLIDSTWNSIHRSRKDGASDNMDVRMQVCGSWVHICVLVQVRQYGG